MHFEDEDSTLYHRQWGRGPVRVHVGVKTFVVMCALSLIGAFTILLIILGV